MTHTERKKYRALFREIARELPPIPKPQEYPGLDAAGYLLVALGHLVKAKEKLDQEPPSRACWHAKQHAIYAANYARRALKVLDELKEEACENEAPPDELPCDDHWHHENPNY